MNFSFVTAPDIRFGRGVARAAAGAAAAYSDRALVVHGQDPARAAWLLEDLHRTGVSVRAISCAGEPDLIAVTEAVALARDARPGVILAVGGGATLDLGKAVAALVTASRPALAYLEVVGEGLPLDAAPLPLIALPTTAGTGAEVTKNAVIGVPEHRRKVSLRDPRMIPNLALVDPGLTDGAPPRVTFASGLDAVTQVIEPFLSTNASPFTEALCRDAIPRGLRALARLADQDDPAARDDMALTSLVGGIALANAGLGAVHGLAGVIGGRTGAPHGEICAALLPHALAHNARNLPAGTPGAEKMTIVFTDIANALGGRPGDAPQILSAWVTRLGIRSIGSLGVTPSDISDIAIASTGASSSKTNPIPLRVTDFQTILRTALES